MIRPTVHFVHANSFPAQTYRLFLEQLSRDYEIGALDMHAHNPAYPVTNGWHELMLELYDELVRRYSTPVVLVGHSMGGILALMLARARPELVRCVVLLDAPVVAGWKAFALRLVKCLGADDKFSPARFSAKRRNVWPSKDDAYRHFAAKSQFAYWPHEVLAEYVEHGLVPHPQGVTLRFTREVETAVYRGLPHHIGTVVRKPFPVPVGFIGGASSLECRQAGLQATRRLVGPHIDMLPGGHLFPLESPQAAAEAVHKMVCSLIHSR